MKTYRSPFVPKLAHFALTFAAIPLLAAGCSGSDTDAASASASPHSPQAGAVSGTSTAGFAVTALESTPPPVPNPQSSHPAPLVPVSGDCSLSTMNATLKGSPFAARLSQPITLADLECSGPWAIAANRPPDAQSARVLFNSVGGWHVTDIGSAIDCVKDGVPVGVFATRGCIQPASAPAQAPESHCPVGLDVLTSAVANSEFNARLAQPITLATPRCASDYAMAVNRAKNAQSSQVLFHFTAGAWQAVTIGSAIHCADHNVPADVVPRVCPG